MEDDQHQPQESPPSPPDPKALIYEAPKLEEHGTWTHITGVSLPIG